MLDFARASKALWFATEAHKRMLVEGREMAYIMHPIEVSMLVGAECTDLDPEPYNDAIQTAMLHDVNEDCPKWRDRLNEEFPEAVCKAVDALTKDRSPNAMQNSLRMILASPIWVRYVKFADRAVNLDPRTIPPRWSKKKRLEYREEGRLILKTLETGTSHPLELFLAQRIEEYPVD